LRSEESASNKKSVDSQKPIPSSKRLHAKVCGGLDQFAMTGNRITIKKASVFTGAFFVF